MAGIYVHIPFCLQRCSYCDFYSTTSLDLRRDYSNALVLEISQRNNFFDNKTVIETLYFGGGTPSVMDIGQLHMICETLHNNFNLSQLQEFTFECNPDDINIDLAISLRRLGVNRISMGVQSFDDNELKMLNRRHASAKIPKAVDICRTAGFENISIDLMYALPGQSLKKWEENIDKAIRLDVEHISAYCLSFEENTPIYKLKDKAPEDEIAEKMYFSLCGKLKDNNYEHYEISNFARKGYRSIHNSSYWNGKTYIGLGAAAHSYDIKSRRWNIPDLKLYIESSINGNILFESEILDDKDKYNELLLTALRTKEGLDLKRIDKKFSEHFKSNCKKFISDGTVIEKNGHFSLNENKYFLSDDIIRTLMY